VSGAILAASPFVGAGVLGLLVAWSRGRLGDCWAALTRRAPEYDPRAVALLAEARRFGGAVRDGVRVRPARGSMAVWVGGRLLATEDEALVEIGRRLNH